MKTTTLTETIFRQLTSNEIDYPLQCISQFWGIETYIESFRIDVYNWIKTACSLSDDQFGDPDDFELLHQQCIKLLEIAHILYTSDESFAVEKDHPIHRPNKECFGYHLEDQQILTCPDLYIRMLRGDEVNDLKIFLEELFEFKSLTEWYVILDQILTHSKEETSFTKQKNVGHLVVEIREYLEKLMETIFIVYMTKSLPNTK